MIKLQLKNWQHALVSLAILVLALWVLYSGLVTPALTDRSVARERIAGLQLQRAKYRSAEQELAQAEQQLERLLNQNLTHEEDFLEEKQHTLAAAELQQYLKEVIESHEGNLISIQPLTDTSEHPFPQVTIKIQMRGNINALQKTLYQLESSRPRLFVDNFSVQPRSPGGRDKQPDGDQLDIRFDVNGYIYVSDS